ncbi:hypothetical protein ES703_36536 [subsurface metagenome]
MSYNLSKSSETTTKGIEMTLFCDVCGDQTIAVRPITIILWDKTEIHGNLCLDCAKKVGKTRRVRASALVRWLIRSGR